MTRTRPQHDAAVPIEAILDAVEAGVVSSSALLVDPICYRAYSAGYDKAEAAATRAIEALEEHAAQADADADRWYERAHNPGKRFSDLIQRRIDQALDEADQAGAIDTEADVLHTVLAAATPAPRGRRA